MLNHSCARVNRMATFQERFWELKGEKSFEVVAKAIGSNKSSLSMFVSGTSKIRKEMLEKLANYFDVDVAYLLGETDIPRKKNFDEDWKKLMIIAEKQGYTLSDIEEALIMLDAVNKNREKKKT